MYNTQQKRSSQFATHCGDDLRGMQHTAEIISAVCNIPQWSSQGCATHRGDDLRGMQHTTEINCTPQNQNQNLHLSLVAFKETIRRNPFRGGHIYHERKDFKKFFLLAKNFLNLRSVLQTSKTTLWSNISTISKILMPVYQCCGSGSAWIGNFCLDPELFIRIRRYRSKYERADK